MQRKGSSARGPDDPTIAGSEGRDSAGGDAGQLGEAGQLENAGKLVDGLPIVVWQADAEGRLRWVSARWTEYTGLPFATTLAEGWASAVHPDDVLVSAFARGAPFTIRARVRRRDGVWRSNEIRASVLPGSTETQRTWVGTCADVEAEERREDRPTDARKRRDHAFAFVGEVTRTLAESSSEDQLLARFTRSVVASFADVCSVHRRDSGGRVRRIAAARASSDQPVTRALGDLSREDDDAPHGLGKVLHTAMPDLVPVVTEEIRTSVARDEASRVALEELGTRSWIIVPLTLRGEVHGAIVLESLSPARTYDLADQVVAEELAQRVGSAMESALLLEDAQRANQLKDEFLSVVSHELRTPLSTILGWAKLLTDDPNPSLDRVKKGLDVIQRNALAQARLVDDILDTSRILRGRVTLDRKTLAFGGPMQEALDAVREAAQKRGVSIATEIDSSTVGKGDATRLRQIFWNLLSNAVKFTPKDGHVIARVRREDGAVVASVIDDGTGIDPSYLPYVFDRFRQADGSPTRRHGGLGIGLAISRKLVEVHGGTIVVESEGLGRGAAFHVRLPDQVTRSEPGTSPGIAIGTRTRAPDLGGIRILLVDDHDDARELYGSVLSLRGARVCLASSASDARARLSESRFDVLVSDIGMPEEDGVSLVRFAREHDRSMRTLAISAYSRPDDIARAKDAGFERYLTKPVDTYELAHTVAELAAARTD